MAGVYQHPSADVQAGVSELSLFFNYNSDQLQWLLLAPGLINWVTKDTHLGLYRNYFGQDIDDNFISDNEWSSQFQCTPAATDPPDFTCPAADQGVAPGSGPDAPADVQMRAADVAYVVAWEKQTGITLNLAFNGVGACTAEKAADESSANVPAPSPTTGARSPIPARRRRLLPQRRRAGQRPPGQPGRLQLDQSHLVPPLPGLHDLVAAGPQHGHRQQLRGHLHRRRLQL